MVDLYVTGYSLVEIGKVDGLTRQRVDQILNISPELRLSPQQKELHRHSISKRRKWRRIQKLCEKYHVTVDELERKIIPIYKTMNSLKLSEIIGYPVALINAYLRLRGKSTLTIKQGDLEELKRLYETGYDISSSNMQRHDKESTFRLYMRLIHVHGTYLDAVQAAGIDPNKIYKHKIAALSAA